MAKVHWKKISKRSLVTGVIGLIMVFLPYLGIPQMGIVFNLTSGFREVFAKQKFGKMQQEFSSKSLLNEGKRSESLQDVPD